MIEQNQNLLEYLTEAKDLAEQSQKKLKVTGMDVFFIDQAIGVVKARLKYLKSVAEKAKSKSLGNEKPEDRSNITELPINPELPKATAPAEGESTETQPKV